MVDWEYIKLTILEGFKEELCRIKQSPLYHAEGDAYTHTLMVCRALEELPEYQKLDEFKQNILYIAALLHDIGKIHTTKFIDGDWHTPNHAPVGSRMARELLWKEYGLCGDRELTNVRETICLLIRYHSFPPHAIEHDNAELKLHRIASNGSLLPHFSVHMLSMLCRADVMGRKCDEQQELLDKIALCEELAKEIGCYDSCYEFTSRYTRRSFLRGDDVWKDSELYDNTWGEVVLMSGLPGTGKDTWIDKELSGLPVISLDEIRRVNKISPTENQGVVANIAREQAKEYLRQHQSFVWNATNITGQMRASLIELFETYKARVRVVYLETDWGRQLSRNSQREAMVPVSVIEGMLCKLVPPESYEANSVEWIIV